MSSLYPLLQTFGADVIGVDLSVNMSHLAFEMLDKVKLKNVSCINGANSQVTRFPAGSF